MKRTKNILLILITISTVGFTIYKILHISNAEIKSDSSLLKPSVSTSQEDRILYSYKLDTINFEIYVPARKQKIVLLKSEQDSSITFQFVDPMDSLNFASTRYIKHDKSIYIVDQKHKIIQSEKYFNKALSEIPFDLYDYVDSPIDGNGPFLFNIDYGLLNSDVFSMGLQIFYLPTESEFDLEKELLRQPTME